MADSQFDYLWMYFSRSRAGAKAEADAEAKIERIAMDDV